MSNQIIYRGEWDNTQAIYSGNTAAPNTGDSQRCIISIYDTEAADNPYNFFISIDDTIGDNEQLTTWNWDLLPADATAVTLSYSPVGAGTFTNNTGSTIAPRQWIIPFGDYDYQITIVRPGGDEVYQIFADTVVDIELSATPVLMEVIDNDEDKYTPIRSKQLTIQLHTSTEIDISTFSEGGDNRYYVEFAVQELDYVVFSGYLSISDLRQAFQPNPNVLTLVATDGLGFLKDIPLTDFDGVNFSGENKLIEYIAGALKKTGLSLQIVTEMGIREQDYAADADGNFFNTIYLNALTFEDGVNEFEDCYTVLEKILGEMCELSQEKNRWYIRRIHEIEGNGSHPRVQSIFGISGDYLEDQSGDEFYKEVGSDMTLYDMGFMNDDAEIFKVRPYKSVRHNFNFEYPQEVPCNSKFIRGDFIENLPDETIDDITYTVKKYELDCWTVQSGKPGTLTTPTSEAYIKRYFIDDYETDKYVVLTEPTNSDHNWIKSAAIPVDKQDKFSFSMQIKFNRNFTGETLTWKTIILLEGDDGVTYSYGEAPADFFGEEKWAVYDGSVAFAFLRAFKNSWNADSFDENNDWVELGGDVSPLPIGGKLYFLFLSNDESVLFDNTVYYTNFNFEYKPYINGSYGVLGGQYHISEQDEDYKATREEDVFISDAPKKLFKGCLLKYSGGEYVKTEGFYDHWVWGALPTSEYIKTYGEIQNGDVWNQYNRVFTGFEGTVDGLDTNKLDSNFMADIPGFYHSFYLRDTNPNTNNKIFKLLHFGQDFHLCEWSAVFIEVFDTTIEKTYTGHTFKYIESDR
jgi:hypothetical protein